VPDPPEMAVADQTKPDEALTTEEPWPSPINGVVDEPCPLLLR